MIVPKQHVDTIEELSDETLSNIMSVAKKIVTTLKELYGNKGYSIMQNGGAFCDFGHAHFHVFPRYDYLSSEMVPMRYCSEWEGSALGGIPKHINDADYPDCPKCGKKMRYLAQLDDEYTKYGNIYIRICEDCKITATSYQQT